MAGAGRSAGHGLGLCWLSALPVPPAGNLLSGFGGILAFRHHRSILAIAEPLHGLAEAIAARVSQYASALPASANRILRAGTNLLISVRLLRHRSTNGDFIRLGASCLSWRGLSYFTWRGHWFFNLRFPARVCGHREASGDHKLWRRKASVCASSDSLARSLVSFFRFNFVARCPNRGTSYSPSAQVGLWGAAVPRLFSTA
jgi:hypothetical protein